MGEEVVEDTGAEVVVDTGEGVVADPAVSGGDSSTQPEAAPEPTAPEFDWAAWDGSEEAIPEEGRFWATGVKGYVTKDYERKIADAARAESRYDAILQGMEDPRLKELEEKVTAGEATWAETKEALRTKEEAFSALEAAHEELIDTQAKAEVEAFKVSFGDILSDPVTSKKLSELMEAEEFASSSLDELGKLVTMDEEDLAAVRKVMAEEKVSTGFAVRFVTASKGGHEAKAPTPAPVPAAPPNPSKSIVAGASKGGRPAKAISGQNKKRPANLEESKLRAAQKYFRN